MLIYWLLLALPALAAFMFTREVGDKELPTSKVFLIFFVCFYSAVAGARYFTGGDYVTYFLMTEYIRGAPLSYALAFGDPGFEFVSYIMLKIGWDLYGINLFCALALVIGCARLAWRTPAPWIGMMAAVPYILIVIGMGYIRQAAAMGFIMLSLVNFIERGWARGIIYFLFAITLHISSLVVVPIVAAVAARRQPLLLVPVAAIGLIAFFFILSGARMDQFEAGYIDTGYASKGAFIRLLMNFVPAVFFLIYQSKINAPKDEKLLWRLVSWISILFLALLPFTPSTTALDRAGLFFAPLQIFVFGYFLKMVGTRGRMNSIYIFFLILYLIAVQMVWLFFAEYSYLWVPYRSFITA